MYRKKKPIETKKVHTHTHKSRSVWKCDQFQNVYCQNRDNYKMYARTSLRDYIYNLSIYLSWILVHEIENIYKSVRFFSVFANENTKMISISYAILAKCELQIAKNVFLLLIKLKLVNKLITFGNS